MWGAAVSRVLQTQYTQQQQQQRPSRSNAVRDNVAAVNASPSVAFGKRDAFPVYFQGEGKLDLNRFLAAVTQHPVQAVRDVLHGKALREIAAGPAANPKSWMA